MSRFFQIILIFTICLPVLVGHGAGLEAYAQTRPDNPERAVKPSEIDHKQTKKSVGAMVVTANPLATDAAISILNRGGNAADAAIAAQLVLGLVEPQSSGLGGGSFALVYDAKNKKLTTLDGRETAPKKADEELFIQNGQPMAFWDAVIGTRSVGTPGTPKLLSSLHKRFGAANWESLFDPSLDLADNGFEISPRMAGLLSKHQTLLSLNAASRMYFLDEEGAALPTGHLLRNADYAKTLRNYRQLGEVAFYRGALAHDLIASIRRAEVNPGMLSLNDLKAYEVKTRQNLCAPYRKYTVCSMGQPSSGGLTLLQILGLLDAYDLGSTPSADGIHHITEASRLAFADRNFYMADPDFVKTPGTLLLSPDYLAERRKLISGKRRMNDAEVTPGIPEHWLKPAQAPDNQLKPPGTTHLSIIDKDGNMVSMTSSIETAFGSHVMTNGFLLNNQLTDFSFIPSKNGWPVANRVEGGKRPRSSMAPTIIFNADGSPYMVIGSAGGSRIIGYVLKSIIYAIDWQTPIDQALSAPHVLSRGQGIEMEIGYEHLHEELAKLGHDIKVGPMNSGLTAIIIDEDGTKTGAADPRREGKAAAPQNN